MTIKQIEKLQKKAGNYELQQLIDSGNCWLMEGFIGRQAMSALEIGACMLPTTPKRNYYGGRIPSRNELKEGSKGTFLNTVNYYKNLQP